MWVFEFHREEILFNFFHLLGYVLYRYLIDKSLRKSRGKIEESILACNLVGKISMCVMAS